MSKGALQCTRIEGQVHMQHTVPWPGVCWAQLPFLFFAVCPKFLKFFSWNGSLWALWLCFRDSSDQNDDYKDGNRTWGTKHDFPKWSEYCKSPQRLRLLKYFRLSSMRQHMELLEFLVFSWDPAIEAFHIGDKVVPILVEDIYFLTWLLMRSLPFSLSGSALGEEMVRDYIL